MVFFLLCLLSVFSVDELIFKARVIARACFVVSKREKCAVVSVWAFVQAPASEYRVPKARI